MCKGPFPLLLRQKTRKWLFIRDCFKDFDLRKYMSWEDTYREQWFLLPLCRIYYFAKMWTACIWCMILASKWRTFFLDKTCSVISCASMSLSSLWETARIAPDASVEIPPMANPHWRSICCDVSFMLACKEWHITQKKDPVVLRECRVIPYDDMANEGSFKGVPRSHVWMHRLVHSYHLAYGEIFFPHGLSCPLHELVEE